MTSFSEVFIGDPNEVPEPAPEEKVEKPEWAMTEAEKRDKAQQEGDLEITKQREDSTDRFKRILSQDKKK